MYFVYMWINLVYFLTDDGLLCIIFISVNVFEGLREGSRIYSGGKQSQSHDKREETK